MSLRIPISIASVAAITTLAACGGYGGGNRVINYPPVASVVANPTSVPAGDNHTTVVTLDGSASSDRDGDALSFLWTVPGGQFVEGTTEQDEVVRVTFPGAAPTTVALLVTDDGGEADIVHVTIGVL